MKKNLLVLFTALCAFGFQGQAACGKCQNLVFKENKGQWEDNILYKAEINAIPILSHGFRMGGFLAVDRQNKEAALRSIEAGAASIRAGNSFLIFPEGTRSRTDDLLPFKKGGFIMAIKAQAPIVPVAIQGGREAMRRGSRVIYPVTISVRVGEPIETAGLAVEDRDQLIAQVRVAIERLLSDSRER